MLNLFAIYRLPPEAAEVFTRWAFKLSLPLLPQDIKESAANVKARFIFFPPTTKVLKAPKLTVTSPFRLRRWSCEAPTRHADEPDSLEWFSRFTLERTRQLRSVLSFSFCFCFLTLRFSIVVKKQKRQDRWDFEPKSNKAVRRTKQWTPLNWTRAQ